MSSSQKHGSLPAKVADRLRRLRVESGMTQSDLGRELCVSYQQIHKYETGVNVISVEKLLRAASVLRVEPCVFWSDKLDEDIGDDASSSYSSQGAEKAARSLVKAYTRISNSRIQKKILELVKKLADSTDS